MLPMHLLPRPLRRLRSRHVKPALLLIAIGVTACTAIAIRPHPAALTMMMQAEGPSPSEIKDALLRVDLGPESLCAAQLNTNSVGIVVDNVKSWLSEHAVQLGSADAEVGSARAAAESLESLVRAGKAGTEQIAQYAAAKSELETALSTQSTLLDGLWTAATSGLDSTPKGVLAKIRANREWGLPTSYLADDHTESEWVALRDALAACKIAAKYGEEPVASAETVVSAAQQDFAVDGALASTEANLVLISTAWNNAINGD